MTMSKSPFWGLPMDEQVLEEIGRRNQARVGEVIDKLGGAWVFARTRRPQPFPPQACAPQWLDASATELDTAP